jgi:hypothetical protein
MGHRFDLWSHHSQEAADMMGLLTVTVHHTPQKRCE